MVFRAVSISGVAYTEEVDEPRSGEEARREVWRTFAELQALLEDRPRMVLVHIPLWSVILVTYIMPMTE